MGDYVDRGRIGMSRMVKFADFAQYLWGPFKFYFHVSNLEVIIENVGLHQTMQNDSGLTKNDT